VEAGVIDSEVVGELVQDGAAHFEAQLLRGQAHGEVGPHEDGDGVGHGAEVVDSAFEQRDAGIEAEQAGAFGIVLLGRPVLDDDLEVVDSGDYPGGQLGEGLVDPPLECVTTDASRPPGVASRRSLRLEATKSVVSMTTGS
jgi:hypothetical protein